MIHQLTAIISKFIVSADLKEKMESLGLPVVSGTIKRVMTAKDDRGFKKPRRGVTKIVNDHIYTADDMKSSMGGGIGTHSFKVG